MTMKKYIFIQAAVFLIAFSLYSQSLSIVRTDIDTSRANFVTATQMFGIDIVIDSLSDYDRIIFDLKLHNINQFKFSNYIASFPNDVATIVYADTNSASNSSSIFVGVFFQDYKRNSTVPKSIIHLDFVVNQQAIHNSNIGFSFENQSAIKIVDGEEEELMLEAEAVSYTVHGFVDVWPGDANNDGLVNENDFIQIGRYYGSGSETKQMRSFARQNASTIWKAQRALAWDNKEHTFADCDGNGEINLIDMLAVYPNYKKTHIGIFKKAVLPQNSGFNKVIEFKDNYKTFPINFTFNKHFQAASIKLKWDNISHIKAIGFIKGNVFDYFDNEITFTNINEEENYAEFVIGHFDKQYPVNKGGSIAYFVYESHLPSSEADFEIEEIIAVDSEGAFFPLQYTALSSNLEMNENTQQISVNVTANELLVNFSQNDIDKFSLSVYDLLGNLLIKTDEIKNFNREYRQDISSLSNGSYYALILVNKRVISVPFIKLY